MADAPGAAAASPEAAVAQAEQKFRRTTRGSIRVIKVIAVDMCLEELSPPSMKKEQSTPMALSHLFQDALDELLGTLNPSSGLSQPKELEATVELFRQLLDAGEQVGPHAIADYVEAKKVPRDVGLELQRVWQVLVLARNPVATAWPPDFIERLRGNPNRR
jgi:hypothetical protein